MQLSNPLRFFIVSVCSFLLVACNYTERAGDSLALDEGAATRRQIVEAFFANYGALGEGMTAFEAVQSPILSPDLVTYNRYLGADITYRGKSGYFQSIEDWAGVFRTGEYFTFTFQEHYPDRVSVRIRTEVITSSRSYTADEHCWVEHFQFDADNKISRLDVLMNLDRQCEEAEDLLGLSPAMYAAARGDLSALSEMTQQGARLDLRNHNGANILYFAAQAKAQGPEIFEFVRRQVGEDKFAELLRATATPNNHTVTLEAVFNVNVPVVDYLLGLRASGVAVDFATPTVFGWTPKTFADRENMPFASELPQGNITASERQAWMDERQNNWLASLTEAERGYHQAGTAWLSGVTEGDIDGVRSQIESGIDLNGRYGQLGATALNSIVTPDMSAEQLVQAQEILALLLQHGADPNFSEGGIMKVPAGFRESVFGYDSLIQQTIDFLRNQGRHESLQTYLNIRGPMNGYTKLIDAALRGREMAITVLLDAGADKSLRGFNGLSAYDAAMQFNELSDLPLAASVLQRLQ